MAFKDDLAQKGEKLQLIFENKSAIVFEAYLNRDSLWILTHWAQGGGVAFRAAYSPGGPLNLLETEKADDHIVFHLKAGIGRVKVILRWSRHEPFLRYTTSVKPTEPLLIPFWPRDVIPLTKAGDPTGTDGVVHAAQKGGRSGVLYLSQTRPKSGSLLYFQNLTALNEYCQHTGTSLMDTVGGTWPELGFALPATAEKPLPAGKEVVISDALVLFDTEVPADEFKMARQFLNMLAQLYLHLPLPETQYNDWLDITEKSLQDLENNPGCWSHVKGHSYLNAYLCDYATPPESMVQLAVLIPLLEYQQWKDVKVAMTKSIEQGLPGFYDEKVGSVLRWLSSVEDELDLSEEQKKPRVMDAWYLHHPMLNLGRMARKGNKAAKKLFLDSLDFVIKVAHEFKYEWPVFYNVDTMEVIKAEREPGKGNQKDVPGLYAAVMLQAWEITGQQKYLNEAKKAAKVLQGKGFKVFYQANNTAFSANALYQLWQETGDELYLNLSYVCLASIFLNVSLWECDYGFAKDYHTFFSLFPLSNAPYTAVYEEQEVCASLYKYVLDGSDILPSLRMLLPEYVRFMAHRTHSYYPPNLPKEMLSQQPRMGQLDPDMWIPLEDLQDGLEPSGQVGQEVYGAGLAFGVLIRHYHRLPEEPFTLYIDYPISRLRRSSGKKISFQIHGDTRLHCRLRIIAKPGESLPVFRVLAGGSRMKQTYEGKRTAEGHMEYTLPGNQKVEITWKKSQPTKKKPTKPSRVSGTRRTARKGRK